VADQWDVQLPAFFLCKNHLAYQWLCGGVSVNYHMLADFRS
jgi:hypothetical protein